MRHRITYVRDHEDGFTPKQVRVTAQSLDISNLRAAKEHSLSFDLDELPLEAELHIRWASSKTDSTRPPFSSRIAPGLHAFYTPKPNNVTNTQSQLCLNLCELFHPHLKCSTSADTFSHIQTTQSRTNDLANWQYYYYVLSLEYFQKYLTTICGSSSLCEDFASRLSSASYLDLDYTAVSEVLKITAYWESGPEGIWHEEIVRDGEDRVEVGVLNKEKSQKRHEIGMGGWLTVLGDDDRPKQTLFSFPSRHHQTASRYSAHFVTPTGLHPTLAVELPSSPQPPASNCGLYAYLTLPSPVFLDRYAFSDRLFVQSHNLIALRSLSGATDLEAPDWAVDTWGSATLFELAKPNPGSRGAYTATIPLHLRYMTPAENTTHANVPVPYPHLFWACPVLEDDEEEDESVKFTGNPFDRVNLGYDAMFGSQTMFYHLQPTPSAHRLTANAPNLVLNLKIPVLDTKWSAWIENGTVAIVLIGTACVLWSLIRPVTKKDAKPADVTKGIKKA